MSGGKKGTMKSTMWINERTGRRLNRSELCVLRTRARAVYAANAHIFEDEADALSALGIVSLVDAGPPR
jgi:hypothetical protein